MELKVSNVTAAQLLKPATALSVYLVNVDKAMALKLLEANAKNRTLAATSVRAYNREMVGNRWELNGDSIRINREGKVIDGQHRLAAIAAIETEGFTVPMLVFTGLAGHSTRTMDDGRKRSAADEINFGLDADEKFGTKIVGALRVLDIFARKEAGGRLTKSTLLALWDNNPLILESVKFVFSDAERAKLIPLRASIVVAMHYVATYLMPTVDGAAKRGAAMVDVMRTGLPTPEYPAGEREDPMHQLRETAAYTNGTFKPWRELTMIRAMTQAWGLYIAGEGKLNAKDLKSLGLAFYTLDGLDTAALYGDMPEGKDIGKEIVIDGKGRTAEEIAADNAKLLKQAGKGKKSPPTLGEVQKAFRKATEAKTKAPATTVPATPETAASEAPKGKQKGSAKLKTHKDDGKTRPASVELPKLANGEVDVDAVAAGLPDDITEKLSVNRTADTERAAEARKMAAKGTVRVHA